MQVSVVNYCELLKYDYRNFLLSPDFFQKDKLSLWNLLQCKSRYNLEYYFHHIKDTIKLVDKEVICYDLTDSLSKFLDIGVTTNHIGSTKKIAIEGDFVISRLRSYLEEMGLVERKEKTQLFSTEYLVFRQKRKELSAHTIFALCMTTHVQTILKRSQYGTEHPRFYEFILEKLPIPDNLLLVDKIINNIIKKSLEKRRLSRIVFQQAHDTLLSELDLANWQPKHQLTFSKKYSDTKATERIDAEYYQPKYEEIIKAIKGYSSGWDKLDNLVHIKKCIEVGSGEYLDDGVPFVRVSNISQFEITQEKYISEALYRELTSEEEGVPFIKSKNRQPEQGEILFSKDGTPGIAYYLKEQPSKMIPSGGILRLKSKTDKVNNEYLTLVLNSVLIQEQINRDVGGSIILHWLPEQVKRTAIPILPKAKQLEIQQKITESFNLRKQSKYLLECARQAVEMAIDQDEQTAIDWLREQTESIEDDNAKGL